MEFLTVLQGLDLAGILQSVVSGVFGEHVFELLPDFGVLSLAQSPGGRVGYNTRPDRGPGRTVTTTGPNGRSSSRFIPDPWTPPEGNFREGAFTAALVAPFISYPSHGGQGNQGGGGGNKPNPHKQQQCLTG